MMKEIEFLNTENLNDNLDKIFNLQKSKLTTLIFKNLSSHTMEDKEETGPSKLGNTLINEIF